MRIINVLLLLLLLLLVIYKQVPVLIKKKVLLSRVDWEIDLNERFFFLFFFFSKRTIPSFETLFNRFSKE